MRRRNTIARPNAARRSALRLELLESRRLLAAEQLTHVIHNPSTVPQWYSEFGAAVATDGIRGIVGAPYAAIAGFEETGEAYLYDLQTGEAITLSNPTPDYYELFGSSVDIDGPLAVVGAPEDGPGSVYIYDATNGNLLRTLSNPHISQTYGFGDTVAIAGTMIVVGLPTSSTAYLYDATTGALLHSFTDPAVSSGDQFGSAVAISGNRVLIADDRQTVGGDAEVGNAHLFDAATGNLLYTFDNPTPAPSDNFGDAVAIDGDTVAIGAWGDSTKGTYAGAAYVFNASSGALVETLYSPTPAESEYFGRSVSTAAGKVYAGAPSRTSEGLAGSVYVFDAASGDHLSTLSDPNPAAGELFGAAVSASDTQTIVGAIYSQVGGVEAGQAFVYAANGELQQTLDSRVLGTEEYFGLDVDISGDTVVVGSYPNDADAGGIVHVYAFSTGDLLYQLKSPEPGVEGTFGSPVSISGGYIAVADSAADRSRGAVHIFDATTGQPLRTFRGTAEDEQFGGSMHLDGDLLAVRRGSSIGPRSVQVFNVATGELLQTFNDHLNESTPTGFGDALDIDGTTLLVGAPYSDQTLGDVGSAYLFDIATGQLLHTLANPTPEARERYGISVDIQGDLTVVGAYLDNTQADSAGAAYVYDTTTGALLWTLLEPAATAEWDDQLGASVAISDTSIYLGAVFDDSGNGVWSGSVHVFDAATGAYQHRLTYPDAADYDRFGDALAVDGHRLVVGANEVDGPTYDRGAVYFYGSPPGITVDVADGVRVAENGSPAQEADTFTVVLDVAPTSDVVVMVQSTDTGEATVSPSRLLFTPANYNTTQTVTVSGVNDNVNDGNQTITVTVSVDDELSDEAYDAATDQTVDVFVHDVPVSPSVLGPSGAGQSTLPEFTWVDGPADRFYSLYLVDMSTTPPSEAYANFAIPGGTTDRFTLPAGSELTPGHAYRYFLRAHTTDGYSESGGTTGPGFTFGDFVVGSAVTGPPEATAATSATTDTTTTISWSPASGAATYEVYLINMSTGSMAASVGGITDTSYEFAQPLAAANYRVFVRAWNAFGTSGFGTPLDFSVGAAATVPAPTAVDNATQSTQPTLSWAASDGAASYEIYLINMNTGSLAASVSGIVETSYTLPAPLPEANYRVFVRAWNTLGTSGFGTPFDFSVGAEVTVPAAPAGLSVADADSLRPTLQWAAAAGASSYSVYFVDVANNALVAHVHNLTDTHYTHGSDLPAGSYGFYVKAHNTAGSSPFSPRFDFQLAPAAAMVVSPNVLSGDDEPSALAGEAWTGSVMAPAVKLTGFADHDRVGALTTAGSQGDVVAPDDEESRRHDEPVVEAVDQVFAEL